MRSTRALSVAFASASVLWAASASADTAPNGTPTFLQSSAANVVKVSTNGSMGRLDGEQRLRYPGYEQTTVVYSRNHIVLVTMEATEQQGLGPVQCACASYELQANGPPKLVAPLTRLTSYEGERACNHPKAAADGNGNIVWAFGSDSRTLDQNNNDRPNMYAGILSEKCEQLAAPTMMSFKRNANDGAPDIQYVGGGTFVAGYYSDGGDGTVTQNPDGSLNPGGRASIALAINVVPGTLLPTLQRTWLKPTITLTDIGRPSITTVSQDRSLFCSNYGPNRPSESVQCSLIDNATGNSVWKDFVAKGDRQKEQYFNQASVTKVDDTHYAVMAIESSGQGKNGRNVKGSNLSHLFMLERSGDSMSIVSEVTGAAAHQTHAAMCAGAYGEAGAPSVAVFSAAPTGIGRAAMQMVSFDGAAKKLTTDPQADLWPAAWYGDSGHLSNWYGRNPMNQGRDFMRCIGNVANPGYHVQNGFMADVKSFFVGAVHGRVPGDAKNSLFVSFVPGQMDKKPIPQNPVPAGESPNLGDQTPPQGSSGSGDSGGCGCTTPGTTTHGALAALAGLAALGLVVARRRNR